MEIGSKVCKEPGSEGTIKDIVGSQALVEWIAPTPGEAWEQLSELQLITGGGW